MGEKGIFLVWAKTSRRSTTLANFFKIKLRILPIQRSWSFFRLFQYSFFALRTFFILLREDPDIIFVQCPPIQILFPVYLYTKFLRSKFIIDAHTGAFIGQGRYFPIYLRWLRFFAQQAIMTILPNQGIVKYVATWKIPFFVLEDWIPDLEVTTIDKKLVKSVGVICGFGADEPIAQIVEATKLVPDVQFYLTGNYPKAKFQLTAIRNLKFTGFLAEADYIKLIKQVDLLMVLTTRADTILCGAYEGLSLEKPLILSDTQTLRHHFPKGTIWIQNTAEAIAQGIEKAFASLPQLQAEISQLKLEKQQKWLQEAKKLKDLITISFGN